MKYVKEASIIIAFTFIGELLNALLPLPVPAGVYGLFLLLFALMSGLVRLPDVEATGNFLLDTMTLMFIPATVAIMNCADVLRPVLLPYLMIILLSTILVMSVTGIVAERILRRADAASKEPDQKETAADAMPAARHTEQEEARRTSLLQTKKAGAFR